MSTKRVIVCGNWKMNLGPQEAVGLAREVTCLAEGAKKTEVWIAPPFVSLPAAQAALQGGRAALGSQNVHWEKSGAFTGEISVPMLREVGCSFAITGHSERRHLLGESSALVAQRSLAALSQDFGVILCIGEMLDEREAGATERVITEQLAPLFAGLEAVPAQSQSKLVLAYEPVWAIGTGKVATLEQIEETHSFVQKLWSERSNSSCPPILYGGSVKPDNFAAIIGLPPVFGALVGGASLKGDQFRALVEIAEQR